MGNIASLKKTSVVTSLVKTEVFVKQFNSNGNVYVWIVPFIMVIIVNSKRIN